jgi:hypothetical protein
VGEDGIVCFGGVRDTIVVCCDIKYTDGVGGRGGCTARVAAVASGEEYMVSFGSGVGGGHDDKVIIDGGRTAIDVGGPGAGENCEYVLGIVSGKLSTIDDFREVEGRKEEA